MCELGGTPISITMVPEAACEYVASIPRSGETDPVTRVRGYERWCFKRNYTRKKKECNLEGI
jgi:hypothetical protein